MKYLMKSNLFVEKYLKLFEGSHFREEGSHVDDMFDFLEDKIKDAISDYMNENVGKYAEWNLDSFYVTEENRHKEEYFQASFDIIVEEYHHISDEGIPVKWNSDVPPKYVDKNNAFYLTYNIDKEGLEKVIRDLDVIILEKMSDDFESVKFKVTKGGNYEFKCKLAKSYTRSSDVGLLDTKIK